VAFKMLGTVNPSAKPVNESGSFFKMTVKKKQENCDQSIISSLIYYVEQNC
jgi:hypothetical protein